VLSTAGQRLSIDGSGVLGSQAVDCNRVYSDLIQTREETFWTFPIRIGVRGVARRFGGNQAGGGLRGICGIPSLIFTHGCAESHQMLTCGCSQDVSSSVPALTQSIVGVAVTSEKIGEPHFEQNLRNTGSPLSPISLNVSGCAPSMISAPFGTATSIENAVPVWRWQFRQLQIAVIRGAASDL